MLSRPRQPSRKPKRRIKTKTLRSIMYHTSFYLFILILAVLLVGSAASLGEQAWRTGGQRKWNIVVVSGAYVALALTAIIHVWSRRLSVKKILRTMPKPYIPTKQMDIPKKVADHIMTEYTRTAVIAHISQATTGQQEGWGRPGTKWENQHFRTYILATLPIMRKALLPPNPHSESQPTSLQPLVDAAAKVSDSGAIRLFVNSYVAIVRRALYGRREPGEGDAAACDKVLEVVLVTLELKRRREEGKHGVTG